VRDLPANFAALLDAQVVAPAFFLHLDWPTGPVYWVTAYGAINWDGKWWQPTGEFCQISEIGESNDARANGVQLTLSGIPSAQIVNAFRNDFQGAKAQIYIGFLNEQGGLITAPLRIFEGQIDSTAFEDSGETSTITVALEKELIDRRDEVRRYTHEDQQLDHPGDLYFEYTTWLAMNPIKFGKYKAGQVAQISGKGLRPTITYSV